MSPSLWQILEDEAERGIFRAETDPGVSTAHVCLGVQASSSLRVKDVLQRPIRDGSYVTSILLARIPEHCYPEDYTVRTTTKDSLPFSQTWYVSFRDPGKMDRLLSRVHVDTGNWPRLEAFWSKIESGVSTEINLLDHQSMRELTAEDLSFEWANRSEMGLAWARQEGHHDDEVYVYANFIHRLSDKTTGAERGEAR